MANIAIIGAGAWGTALANVLASQHEVTLYVRSAQQLHTLQQGYNQQYLPNISLNLKLKFSINFEECIQNASIVIVATPSQTFLEIIQSIFNTLGQHIASKYLVWLCKGFMHLNNNVYLPHQALEHLKQQKTSDFTNYGVLTGPSFAQEVAQGLPCALVAASTSEEWRNNIQSTLHQTNLRIYTHNDILGCELGGALKNILAIATGIAEGLNLGLNAQAAIITRGISEMMRIGHALGAQSQTLMGLSGLGDVILTATGNLSRNRSVGIALAQGKTLLDIIANLGHVAEGVKSTEFAYQIARTYNLDTPLIDSVYNILYKKINVKTAVDILLSRYAKPEYS
jgi:glycerol-3-phosphate dehydrogenase (NAD(P)+)